MRGGGTYDFRIKRPSGLQPAAWQNWSDIQHQYERWSADEAERATLGDYLREIDSVKEIYESEFRIEGRVLDVGGHQGRLRHHLQQGSVDLYVVVDPFLDVFRYVTSPLLEAYPCLEKPLNFIGGQAEFLPFSEQCFDWVHLRSVVDHLADPWLALKEAWRVLRPGGRILVGLTIEERIARTGLLAKLENKLRHDGLRGLAHALRRRALHILGIRERDDHTWRLTLDQVRQLCTETNFRILKETWQKAPWNYVLYFSAEKVMSGPSE